LGLTHPLYSAKVWTPFPEETSKIILLSSFTGSAEGLVLNKAFLKIEDHKVRKSIIALVKSVASLDELPPTTSAADGTAGQYPIVQSPCVERKSSPSIQVSSCDFTARRVITPDNPK
jgi:hypothetical protein